jgi:hypothetical protein
MRVAPLVGVNVVRQPDGIAHPEAGLVGDSAGIAV